MGQIVKLSNKIVESGENYIIEKTENHKGWKEYVESELSEANRINRTQLGGRDPREPNQEIEVRSCLFSI